MGDMEKAVDECRTARFNRREITDACARVIGSMYHEGQSSASYAFASTGYICDEGSTRDVAGEAVTGLWREMFPDYGALTAEEQVCADMMGTYLLARIGDGRWGRVGGWSKLWL